MSGRVFEHSVGISNLNVTPRSMMEVNGRAFEDFVSNAGYHAIEATVLRPPVMRRTLGEAAHLVNGLQAPFASRSFSGAVFDTLRHPKDVYRNIRGIGFAALMPKSDAVDAMAKYQSKISIDPLDAVLYPHNGDSPVPQVFDNKTAPFLSRSFQVTAEVLHRWGVNMRPGAETEEQITQMRVAMAKYGFNAVTLDGLHVQRKYMAEIDGRESEVGLSDDFVAEVIETGLVNSYHVSVGRNDLPLPPVLKRQNNQDAEIVRTGDADRFLETKQGEWLSRALEVAESKGSTVFRSTVVQPGSLWMKDGKLVGDRHAEIVETISSI